MNLLFRAVFVCATIAAIACGEVSTSPVVDAPPSVDAAVDGSIDATPTYTLTVATNGDGSGTVASAPAGINCGADCTEDFPVGTSVVLTATPAAGSTFVGWTGSGCSGTGTCTVSSAATVTAAFALNQTLVVTLGGTGTGRVTSAPAGIDCGTDCSEPYAPATMVTLTATANPMSTFTGWSGGGCSGTGPCTVTVNGAVGVTATFTLDSYPLTVTRAGTGTGTVTSAPAGINCGADCAETYTSGTMVTLTAAPNASSTFAGWSGACTGTGTCAVTMAAATSVTATFTLTTHTVSVVRAGNGTGTVTSAPAGINCGATCSATFASGTSVTLTATPAAGSTFTGWSGACSGTGTCVVTVTGAVAVAATFTLNQYTLTAQRAGTGTGTVTSSPAGITCGADCTEVYNHGTAVTLTAAAAVGSTFAGWSGGGCAGTGTCVVTRAAATTVTATFTLNSYTLTVARAGGGTGTVTSSPAGITCGTDCTEVYNHGTSVTLTAAAAGGSTFAGWSGACTGAGACTVSMTAAQSVTATFNGALVRIGNTTQFPENSMHGAGFLLGEKVVVSSARTLRQIGLIAIAAGPQFQLALYTDVGGAPGTLVAQTAIGTLTAGTMEVPITAGSVPIAAGTYWIMGIYNTNASIGYTTGASTNVVAYRSLTFGSALPSPFGTAMTYTGQSFNYWIVVQ